MASQTDPLAGTDTYDILAGLKPEDLPDQLERWGRMEQHELMQMPGWASMVGLLLREAAKEIRHLRAAVPPPDVREVMRERMADFAEIKRASRAHVKAELVGVVRATTVDGAGC